jgi:hypothetical protein
MPLANEHRRLYTLCRKQTFNLQLIASGEVNASHRFLLSSKVWPKVRACEFEASCGISTLAATHICERAPQLPLISSGTALSV